MSTELQGLDDRNSQGTAGQAVSPRGRRLSLGAPALLGAALGACLMYLLDPDRGRRRRALVRDRVVHLSRKTQDAIEAASKDLGNRAHGSAARLRSSLSADEASDEVIAERVRARLGSLVRHPRSIEVVVERGRARLSGPVLADELDGLLKGVASVRGVSDVGHRLAVHERAGNVAGLQGGRESRPTGQRFELLQRHWSPAARFLTGTAGSALAAYGTRRSDAIGIGLGIAGLALAARGITNTEFRHLIGRESAAR